MDWRHHIALRRIEEGCNYTQAASAAGVSRIALWMWTKADPEFAELVNLARENGKAERTYRQWLYHPFRGLRPPIGKGNGCKPRFTYGRRG